MEREEVINTISDAYKEAYGFRPRFYNFNEMTDLELVELQNRTLDAAEAALVDAEEQERVSAQQFEDLITTTIQSGAANRETAIRWLLDAEKDKHPPEHLVWMFCCENNLPYSYVEEMNKVNVV